MPTNSDPRVDSRDIARTTQVTLPSGLRVTFLADKFVTILPLVGSSGIVLTAGEVVEFINACHGRIAHVQYIKAEP